MKTSFFKLSRAPEITAVSSPRHPQVNGGLIAKACSSRLKASASLLEET